MSHNVRNLNSKTSFFVENYLYFDLCFKVSDEKRVNEVRNFAKKFYDLSFKDI